VARDSSGTKQVIAPENVDPLASFPLYAAFPHSEYYGASATHRGHWRICSPWHSLDELPMFTVMDSTRLRRRRFCPNFRSLRLPERQQGRSGWPAETRWTEPNTPQSRQSLRKHSTLGFVRCPVSVWCPPPDYPGYSVAGVRFPVGQLSASLSLFDSPYSLFVKHRLLAAWVAPHGYL
jgi:hypothetical protein